MPLGNPRNPRTFILLGHLGAFVTICAWANSFLASRVLLEDGGLTPVETFVYRFALAYIVLLAFTCRKRLAAHSWRDELTFLICGICAGSLYFILENYALTATTTGNVSLLASIAPIFTTLLSAIVFKTRMNTGIIIGSVLSFLGVGCVIFSHGEGLAIQPKGDILAISAAVSWAIYTILIKRVLPFYGSFFVTRKLSFYGVITALPIMFIQDEPLHLNVLFDFHHPMIFTAFLFLGLICSLGAFVIWNESMKILGPVTANNYLYLQPIITMIAAFFIFGEKIFPLGYIGCVLVIGGLILTDKSDVIVKRK